MNFVLKKDSQVKATAKLKLKKMSRSSYISEEVIKYYLGLESNYTPKYKFKGSEEDGDFSEFIKEIKIDYTNSNKKSSVKKYYHSELGIPEHSFEVYFSENPDIYDEEGSFNFSGFNIFFIEKNGKVITYFVSQSSDYKKITFIGIEFNGDKFKKVDEVEVEMEWKNK